MLRRPVGSLGAVSIDRDRYKGRRVADKLATVDREAKCGLGSLVDYFDASPAHWLSRALGAAPTAPLAAPGRQHLRICLLEVISGQLGRFPTSPPIRNDASGPFVLRHRVGRLAGQSLGTKERLDHVLDCQATRLRGVELDVFLQETIKFRFCIAPLGESTAVHLAPRSVRVGMNRIEDEAPGPGLWVTLR